MHRKGLLVSTALIAATALAAKAQEGALDLGTVVLETGFRDGRDLLDSPVAASVRDREALESQQAGDFEELIGDIPGVSIDGGPRSISQEPNIRGFRDEQVVLRFDGGRLNFGQAHRGRFFLDPDLVQRVEVVRGGGSTLFGSGALGGVISVETVDAADLLLPGQTFGGRTSLGFSSNGDQLNASQAIYGDFGTIDALAAISGRSINNNLTSGDGFDIPFSELDGTNTLLKFGAEPNAENRIEFSFGLYDDEGLVPANSSEDPSVSNPVVERDAEVRDVRLGWDFEPIEAGLIDLSLLIYSTQLEITEDRIPPGAPRFDETIYDTLGLEIVNRSTLDVGRPVTLVYGVEAFRDTQEGFRDGALRLAFPNAEATTIGVFTEATIALGSQLDLIAGARFDSYERDPNDGSLEQVSEEFFAPRIGVSFRPTERLQIFGNLSRAFRAPTLSELYNDGLHFAGGFPINPPINFAPAPNNFFVPNPNLEPEESTQFEIGARFENEGLFRAEDNLSLSVNAYYADVENYIEQVVNLAAGTTTSDNVDATLWGFEAEVDYDATLWFVGGGLSIARGDGDGDDPLGSIPADRLTLHAGLRPFDDWEFGARATIADDQDRVPEEVTASDGYQTLDLYAAFSPSSGPLANGTLRVGIDNIFDEEYRIHPNGLPQPGQSFEISATFRF